MPMEQRYIMLIEMIFYRVKTAEKRVVDRRVGNRRVVDGCIDLVAIGKCFLNQINTGLRG